MKRFWLSSLLLGLVFHSASPQLAAQSAWRAVPSESASDHKPLPFLKAIGIPATAIFRGEKHKAFVFIHGHEKGPEAYGPQIDIYVEGLHQFVPAEELELFEGPDESDAAIEIRAMSVSIKRGKQVYRATNGVDLHMGDYPTSIVGEDDNNVFGSGVYSKGPRRATWARMLREMSSGFDEGHISFGGNLPSSKFEIDFSGEGIEPLLKDLLRFVGD